MLTVVLGGEGVGVLRLRAFGASLRMTALWLGGAGVVWARTRNTEVLRFAQDDGIGRWWLKGADGCAGERGCRGPSAARLRRFAQDDGVGGLVAREWLGSDAKYGGPSLLSGRRRW